MIFYKRKTVLLSNTVLLMAERVGFEPTVVARTTTVFETAPIGHSGTSPNSDLDYTKGTCSVQLKLN